MITAEEARTKILENYKLKETSEYVNERDELIYKAFLNHCIEKAEDAINNLFTEIIVNFSEIEGNNIKSDKYLFSYIDFGQDMKKFIYNGSLKKIVTYFENLGYKVTWSDEDINYGLGLEPNLSVTICWLNKEELNI